MEDAVEYELATDSRNNEVLVIDIWFQSCFLVMINVYHSVYE